MTKNLLFAAAVLAVLTLAGCQKTEPASGLGDNDAIGFSPYMGREITKASVTDVTAANLSSFKAACYLTGTATTYFDSEQTATKNASGYWATSDTYYWPTSAMLDFFAYCGSGSGSVSNTGGVAKVSYTVPSSGTEDFVVAYALNQGKPSSSPYAQSLSFGHALSKVKQLTLSPKSGDASADSKYRYIVTDVRIAGAKDSADYTFNPSSGSNWGAASGGQDYAFDDRSFNFLGSSSHKLEVGTESKVNDQIIILPQEATFSVTYSVEYSGDGGTTWSEIMASSTKTADISMEMGKAYTINLQLPNDASPIVFNASVGGWSDADAIDKEVTKPVLLSGEFSVSADKKVKFAKGNLYWDGGEFHLEDSQTAYPSVWDADHVGHFFWTSLADYKSGEVSYMPYAASYSYSSQSTDDKFWCGEDNKLTVDGQSGLYALSSAEWTYLVNTGGSSGRTDANRFAKARVDGVNGLIIFPDGYNGGIAVTGVTGVAAVNTISAAYPTDNVADWSAMEGAGCVFLPAAGYRGGSSLSLVGSRGYYWSSTPYYGTGYAYSLCFYSGDVLPAINDGRDYGHGVRLVSAAQ